MYKLSEQEFAKCLFNFQIVTCAHLLTQLKGSSATESISEVLKLTEKYVANDLVNAQRDKILSNDEQAFKELYEHYLRRCLEASDVAKGNGESAKRISEKKYLEIDQYQEEEYVLD